jgi:hypothetical protein
MKEPNDNFENKWKEQFQGTEATPSASVWDRIDARLAGHQLARYKKKLFYYKITAAASILLALLFGSYSIYNIIQEPESLQMVQDVSTHDKQNVSIDDNRNVSVDGIKDESELDNESNQDNIIDNSLNERMIVSEGFPSENESAYLLFQEPKSDIVEISVQDEISDQLGISYRPIAIFYVPYEKPGRKYYLQKKINPYDMPYMLPLEDEVVEDDPKRLWAGINFSSGVFDPNISYKGPADIAADAATSTFGSVEKIYSTSAELQEQSNSIMSYKPEESSYESNASFSYGLNFGYKFSKRFVVLSGLGYQHNYGSTTVNTYIEPTKTHAKYANHAIVIERASPESGLNTYNELSSEVQLNSTFEFVTIPVDFGYYLVDKKFKWMMIAGVSTDIFIRNSIDDSQNLFDQIQYKTGDDSPYNPVYFNGKFGTMLNYSFLKNYQISLEPSYRIGISDLTKDNAAFSSRPSSFLISAGIAYVF